MVANILQAVWGFAKNSLSVVTDFFSRLLAGLFNGLITVLKAIFRPILALVAILFYCLYKLAELFITVFQVLLAVGKLFYAFVMGIVRTLAGLTWTAGAPPDHGSWSGAIANVFSALQLYQLDKIAYVMMFVIWLMTAVAAVRILSRGGAD